MLKNGGVGVGERNVVINALSIENISLKENDNSDRPHLLFSHTLFFAS